MREKPINTCYIFVRTTPSSRAALQSAESCNVFFVFAIDGESLTLLLQQISVSDCMQIFTIIILITMMANPDRENMQTLSRISLDKVEHDNGVSCFLSAPYFHSFITEVNNVSRPFRRLEQWCFISCSNTQLLISGNFDRCPDIKLATNNISDLCRLWNLG